MLEKVKEAIDLFIKNSGLFSLIVLTVWLPGSILIVYLRFYIFSEMASGDELQILVKEIQVSSIIESIFGPFYIGALLYASSQFKKGLKPSYRESMAQASQRSFRLLVTRMGTGLIILAGYICFIIPGIILSLRFALVDAVVVLERKTGGSARNLSTKMTQGKRGQIFGSTTLTFLGVLILIILLSMVLYVPLTLSGQEDNFIIAVIYECLANILLTLPSLVLFLFYWEVKEERTSIEEERLI